MNSRKIDTPNILDFYDLAANGFVILASQYRGNDGGEGREEFGGADVNDVTNLLSLAASLRYADPKNVFFYGLSGGGMMTFLARRRGAVMNDEAANNRPDRDARIVAWFRRFRR